MRTFSVMAGGGKGAMVALLAVLLFMVPSPRARADDPSRLTYHSLGVAEGLANDSVYCVYQDSSGFMWFGTFGGLSRYDGESITTYRPHEGQGALQASVVFALIEDGRGDLWVGTDGGGLARYNRDKDSFTVIRATPADPAALSSDRVLALGCDAKGRLWAGTGDGILNVLDPGTGRFTRLLPPGGGQRYPIRCIVTDKSGRVWAGTEGGGLVCFDPDGSMQAYLHDPVDPASIGSDVVRSLLVDGAGRLVAGLGEGGVDLLLDGRFLHAHAKAGSRIPEEAVRALVEDPEGDVWIGWADSGIGILDSETLSLSSPAKGEEAMIRALYRDRGGLVWAGIKGGGTRTYNVASGHFQRFVQLASGEGIRQARGMAELPDGRVLAGSDGQGLLVLDARRGTAIPYPGMPRDRSSLKVYSVIVGSEGSVWVGTDGAGLIRKRPDGSIERYRRRAGKADSISSDVVWSLLEDSGGRIWVGTEGNGLDRLDPASGRVEHFRHEAGRPGSIQGSSIRSLYRDRQGRLWIGTWDGGLSRLDPGSTSFVNYLSGAAASGSLPDASVNCVLEDSVGNIWVGTGGSGLACLDAGTGAFRRYDVAAGLVGSTVYGLLDDRHGLIWVATATGLSSLDRESGAFFSYGSEDGLVSGGLSQNAYLATGDGALWVGGPGGMTRFFPAEAARAMPTPRVAITSVLASDGLPPRRSADGTRIILPPGNAGLGFRIAVLDYSAPSRNRYAMKLEGRQSGWTELGYSNAGALAQLAPGEYLLRVKGANGNGVWNEEGASLGIVVEPPFWGTLWFRLCAIGLAAALAALAIALRTRNLKARNALLVNFARHVEDAREEERTDAAREVHDEIGQHLAVANLQSYWLRNHPEAAVSERSPRLEVLQTAISEALGAVKAVATRLRPIALDALSFGETASWYARDFERRTGITCKATIGTGIPPLTDAEATALFRVLQEALANVARHAGAHNVAITLSSGESWVVLSVDDDGRGMEAGKADAPDAFGIIGMRERCAAFGGGLEVRSAPGQGSTVVARVPSKGRD
jgi:signal transduction histidine kinase/ligand-binding sensor domain-containing protein